MADSAVLKPIPGNDGSLYRVEKNKLVVEVENTGGDSGQVTVSVDFDGYGTKNDAKKTDVQKASTKSIKANDRYRFEFEEPCDDCFDPECEIYIKIEESGGKSSPAPRGDEIRVSVKKPYAIASP